MRSSPMNRDSSKSTCGAHAQRREIIARDVCTWNESESMYIELVSGLVSGHGSLPKTSRVRSESIQQHYKDPCRVVPVRPVQPPPKTPSKNLRGSEVSNDEMPWYVPRWTVGAITSPHSGSADGLRCRQRLWGGDMNIRKKIKRGRIVQEGKQLNACPT